jgi:hypothetical protein
MEAQNQHQSPHRPRHLLQRALNVMKRHTDDPSGAEADAQHGAQRRTERQDPPPPLPPIEEPTVQGAETWSQVGAVKVPKSHSRPNPVQLPDSRPEPGGPPVYADPNMVTPAAAEKMRPLFRRNRT